MIVHVDKRHFRSEKEAQMRGVRHADDQCPAFAMILRPIENERRRDLCSIRRTGSKQTTPMTIRFDLSKRCASKVCQMTYAVLAKTKPRSFEEVSAPQESAKGPMLGSVQVDGALVKVPLAPLRAPLKRWSARAIACIVCGLNASCSVYSADLIAIKSTEPRTAEPPMNGGAAPDASPIEDPPDDAGAESADAQSLSPAPIDTTHCGDGRVSGEEKCDVGIAPGMPGACPTSCPDLAPCVPRALNNSGCQAACVVLQLLCTNDDDCCPGNCTDKNDNDCSSNCGDGVIQASEGETCESESSLPCKTNDRQCDDMDACTVDKLIGAAQSCNAFCTNTRITTPKDGDGCCPAGADANRDKDCSPVCGNNVRESAEECDGTPGCDPQCRLSMLKMDQIRCSEQFADDGDECALCSCMNCTQSYLLCRDSPSPELNALCLDVLVCAREKNCYGTACYCGDSLFCIPPNGLCRTQIEAATGSTDPNLVNARATDPGYAVGRAYAAEMCRAQQCGQQCRM